MIFKVKAFPLILFCEVNAFIYFKDFLPSIKLFCVASLSEFESINAYVVAAGNRKQTKMGVRKEEQIVLKLTSF